MNLESQTVRVADLAPEQIAAMLRLMQAHYEGVTEPQFRSDLRAKQWVILLTAGARLAGFSTQVPFEHTVSGRRVRLLFSGDTIIEKHCWGSQALPIAWGRLMLSLLAQEPTRDLFWLLTSKGYKTYRFLPVFFREFYPCHSAATPPFERELLAGAARERFGARFDAEAGVLRAEPGAQRLREGLAELDSRRLRDPHVAFFHARNPGHAQGDELVCLARFDPDNLTPYIRRQLGT